MRGLCRPPLGALWGPQRLLNLGRVSVGGARGAAVGGGGRRTAGRFQGEDRFGELVASPSPLALNQSQHQGLFNESAVRIR